MYILMYVSTMLMLLVLMTYGRIESYSGFGYVQAEFKNYMEIHEREFINEQARKKYESITASSKNGDDKSDPSQARADLPFNFFVNKKERESHPKEFEQYKIIAQRLIYNLYGNKKFFKEQEEKHHDLINDILNALIAATNDLEKPPKKIKALSTIELNNFDLNQTVTYMLNGSSDEEGYPSLEDFLTLSHGNYKIRVYLASQQLLEVLFNPGIVSEILNERKILFNEVKGKDGMKVNEASKIFQDMFLNQRQSYVNPEILDFGVSKTDPKT